MRSYPGGSSSYLSRVFSSVICGPESLWSHLSIEVHGLTALAPEGSPIRDLNFGNIIRRFLEGTGVPCPALWGAKPIPVSSRLDMTEVDSPTFRSRALCWAATGTPLLPSLDDDIQLILGELGDGISAIHMQEGTIAFHTCSREAHLPLEFLLHLYSQSYPAQDENGQPTEPRSLEQAIEHWLFTQVVGSAGDHSIA